MDSVGPVLLSDVQWAAIVPHLPMAHTGPRRVDNRRVISGTVHRFGGGCRWRALPPEYGPYTTVFNRWNRWNQRELWQGIFAVLVARADPQHHTRKVAIPHDATRYGKTARDFLAAVCLVSAITYWA
jgi:transposase